MNWNAFINALLVALIIGNFLFSIVTYYFIVADEEIAEMIHADFRSNNVSGIYIPQCGYFVDTRYSSYEDIKLTEAHEQVHKMIRQDDICGNVTCKEHFCE